MNALNGRIVMVTGAAGGIGYETTLALGLRGAHLVLLARDNARGPAAVDALRKAGVSSEFIPVDMASMHAVRAAAARFDRMHRVLDVLVNNAGVALKHRTIGPDGFELTWATNFLGGFLLTQLLLPALERSSSPRVVNVSSDAHRVGRIAWDDPTLEHDYGAFKAYAQSKLAQILFTRELARRRPGVTVTAVHPGGVATGIWRAMPKPAQLVVRLIMASPAKGAEPVVRLATESTPVRGTGRYFNRLREVTPAPQALDDRDAARLWELAERSTALR